MHPAQDVTTWQNPDAFADIPEVSKNDIVSRWRCNLIHAISEDGSHEQTLQCTVHIACVAQVVQTAGQISILYSTNAICQQLENLLTETLQVIMH